MNDWYVRWGKRAIDVALSGIALITLSPLLALVAIAIRLDTPGSVVFRQQRSGRGRRLFVLYKFRSMPINTVNVPSASAVALTVTRVGRIIRRTNVDELPQLVNVLKGDMSLIGPRPALPSQTDLLRLRERGGATAILPGLTGLAQVNSYDGMTVDEKAAFDCAYARDVRVSGDVRILLRTFLYLARRPPVY